MDRSFNLKPMPLGLSLLFFGVPTAIGMVGLYMVLPALNRAGVPLLWNYTISFAGMLPLLLGAALVTYRLEGHTIFHAPLWWNLISLLPSTLSLSFVASRLKNTTPGIIVHLVMNGLGYVVVLLGILGVGTRIPVG